MSCAGVMYQPYSSATPLSAYLTPASTPAPPTPQQGASPPTTSPTAATAVHYPADNNLTPLPLKRELAEKVYKVERDASGQDLLPRLPPSLQSSHQEPFSVSPRGQSSAGSCGTPDPRTPITPRPASQQERESDGEDELHRTAQYLARNVILYTHYVGEVSRIVDEHFSKALDQTTYNEQKVAPMASRNLPPSFFNAHYHAQAKAAGPGHYSGPASDLYSSEAYSGLHHLAAHHHAASGSPDPWQYAAQATANSPYHRSVQDLAAAASGYSSSQASRLQSQYQSLFLNNPATAAAATSRLHAAAAGAGPTVKSEVPWSGSGDYHTPGAGDFSHHLDRNYSPHPYANMPPSGLEPTQDGVKDLYWPTF